MTYDEFQAEIAKNPDQTPDLMKTLYEKHEGDFTKHLTEGKKMIVTDATTFATDRQKAIDEGSKKAHEAWEGKVAKVTGQTRPEGKKGLDWFDELSAKLKYGVEDGADPNSAMIKGLKKELEELKTNLSTAEKKALQARIDGQVNAAIKGLKFAVPGHLKKDDEKSAFARQKAEDAADIFNARYTTSMDDQGRVVFTNKKGEAQTQDGEPMTADQIAARDFANEMAPKGNQQGGAGSNDNSNNGNGNADWLGKDTAEIRTKIAEMGHGMGSAKWRELYDKAHVAAGYRKENDVYVK